MFLPSSCRHVISHLEVACSHESLIEWQNLPHIIFINVFSKLQCRQTQTRKFSPKRLIHKKCSKNLPGEDPSEVALTLRTGQCTLPPGIMRSVRSPSWCAAILRHSHRYKKLITSVTLKPTLSCRFTYPLLSIFGVSWPVASAMFRSHMYQTHVAHHDHQSRYVVWCHRLFTVS